MGAIGAGEGDHIDMQLRGDAKGLLQMHCRCMVVPHQSLCNPRPANPGTLHNMRELFSARGIFALVWFTVEASQKDQAVICIGAA